MHILAGESALRALRTVRSRELAVPVARLTPQPQEARLPDQDKTAAPSPGQVPPPDLRTLADGGFPFKDIEANMRLELWQLGDAGPFTPARPLELAVFDRAHRTRGKKYRTRELPKKLRRARLRERCVSPAAARRVVRARRQALPGRG